MAKFALLIGVGNYDYPNAVRPLSSAHQDVAALRRVLLDSELGDFSEVISLLDPDPYQMQTAIEALFRDRQKEDLLLLYYSGHGFKDDAGNLYFSTRVTQKTLKGELVKASAVPTRFVHEILSASKSKRQVIILDCCYSGAFDLSLQPKAGDDLSLWQHLGAEGRIALTSSSSTQYSYELAGTDLSLYTRYLVEGIESGAADKVGDGKISVHDLHEYVSSKVQESAPSMSPKMITLKDEGFDIVLTKAKTLNPQLRYQREAEKFAYQAIISPVGRAVLDTLREQLGLSLATATEIEEQVLRPYRSRLKNRERYREILRLVVEQEHPLLDRTCQELTAFQNILGLRSDEVQTIEQEVFAQHFSDQVAPEETSRLKEFEKSEALGAILVQELSQAIESRSQLEAVAPPLAAPKGANSSGLDPLQKLPAAATDSRAGRSGWVGAVSVGAVVVGAIGVGGLSLQHPLANQISQRSLQQIEAMQKQRSSPDGLVQAKLPASSLSAPTQPTSSRSNQSTSSQPPVSNCGAANWFSRRVQATEGEWKAAIALARQISPATSYYSFAQSEVEQWTVGLGLAASPQFNRLGRNETIQLARSLHRTVPTGKKGQE